MIKTFICFTFSGEGLAVAYQMQKEGREVIVGMIEDEKDIMTEDELKNYKGEDPEKKKRRKTLYEGLLHIVPAKKLVAFLKTEPPSKETFLFFDFNQCFKFAEQLQALGFQGNFPTEHDRTMETDRHTAKEFIQNNYPDIKVAEEQDFKTAKEGIDFLKDTEDVWVLKGNSDEAKTVVPEKKDPESAREQLITVLKENPKAYESAGYILERMIINPIEITPEMQFYNGVPLFSFIDMENKPIGSGNLSIQTGCAQDLLVPTPLNCYINKISFPPIVYEMAKEHKGWFIWDVSLLFDPETGDAYAGEFCPNRPGYDSLVTELELAESTGDFFDKIVEQKNPFEKAEGLFSTSVRLFDFQKDKETMMAKIDKPIRMSEEAEDDVWLLDAKKGKGTKFVTAGYFANCDFIDIGVVTGQGHCIEDAAEKVYKVLDQVNYDGGYYRPLFDFISCDYPTSIINRYNYYCESIEGQY